MRTALADTIIIIIMEKMEAGLRGLYVREIDVKSQINQSIKNLKHAICIGLGSPIRRRNWSLGSGHKGCFEQISFDKFSECLHSQILVTKYYSKLPVTHCH